MLASGLLFGILCILNGQDNLDQFQYNQSTLQAFYFFENVMLDGHKLDSDDWVAAFKGDVCVGAYQWDVSACGGGICAVPAMGVDGSEDTQGYMEFGEIPIFKVYDASSDEIIEMIALENIGEWAINGFNSNYFLVNELNFSVNDYQFNGSAAIKVILAENQINDADTLLAIIDGDLRGKQGVIESPLGEYIYPLMVHSNLVESEIIDFYLYQSATNEVIKFEYYLEFESDMIMGSAIDPIIITDCDGEIDECGVCDGEGAIYECGCTDIEDGYCDCNGSIEDDCGVCNGDNTTCMDVSTSLPPQISILNAFPNPFNPSIQISVNTNESGLMEIEVYDLFGRGVKKLYDGFNDGQYFQINWSPKDISSGNYIIKLSQNNHTEQLMVTYEK